MLVVLGDFHRHLRDLVLLVAIDDTQVGRSPQIGAAAAATLREPIFALIRRLPPGQIHPRSTWLFTTLTFRCTAATFRGRCRRRLTQVVIFGWRTRGVFAVARQQMFQLRQSTGQRLVGVEQASHLRGHRRDLRILSNDPSIPSGNHTGLLVDERDQLIARQLFPFGHNKILLHPHASSHERHALDRTEAECLHGVDFREVARSSWSPAVNGHGG
ncbi:MAG TPA: hypothetical protein VHX38_30695 [Pseudonocardiaceae bacterium]|nr:hypothetical protein [Pseudonocardiaceae bacterium]